MIRPRAAATVAGMALAPAAAFVALAALGEWSWASCLHEIRQPFGPAFGRALGLLAHPLALAGLAPFPALAALWLWRRPRRAAFLVWLALCAALLWMLLPPGSLHDCDRKGTDTFVIPLLLAAVGWLAILIALALTRPARRTAA